MQRQLGLQGLADLLHFGYDQGLFLGDTADGNRTHPHMREALKRVPRYALSLECVDCFTIGPADRQEFSDLLKRILAASRTAKAA